MTICRFNHSGSKLATGSKDQTVIIWNVNSAGHVTLDKTLHIGAPCCYLTWSPDDQHILVTGNEECSDIWLFDVKAGIQVRNTAFKILLVNYIINYIYYIINYI